MEPKQKKLKALQRYRSEYSKEWPCLKNSRISEYHVFCIVCSCDFSVQHGGRDDCRRHVQSKKHVQNGKINESQPAISNFFQNNNEDINDVIKSEMLFTSFLVEHNIPISCTDHAGPLFRAMFPDSKIAKKYGCARTKTTSIIQSMASSTQEDIAKCLQKNPFSLATDGSNDSNDIKLYPVVVSYFNETAGQIDTMLLSIGESSDNTGEGIFRVLENELKKREVPWKNCLSFASDNANTMIGQHKGVVAFLKEVQPSIVTLGCSCHLIHLAAKKATAELKQVNVEEFLVQLYYFLDKSSKRKSGYKLSQIICGMKPHKILKYVSTRWLSLLDAVNRVLDKWEALEHYLCNENSDAMNLKSQIKNPLCKLYLLFLSNALQVFNAINVSLQQEEPSIHILHRQLMSLFTELIVRFVKPSALGEDSASILDIDLGKKKHLKDDSDLVIGAKARSFLKGSELTKQQVANFHSEVRNFYKTACEYMLKKFPLRNHILKHAEVADISLRKTVTYSSVQFILSLFPTILTGEETDRLESEFASYQFETIDESSYTRMDAGWFQISQKRDISGVLKYTALPKLMLAVLLIPHSNAVTERVFSIVRKNQTDFRPNLSSRLLSALLVEKVKTFSTKQVCHKRKFSEQEIKSAKQAAKLSIMSNDENGGITG